VPVWRGEHHGFDSPRATQPFMTRQSAYLACVLDPLPRGPLLEAARKKTALGQPFHFTAVARQSPQTVHRRNGAARSKSCRRSRNQGGVIDSSKIAFVQT